MALPTTTVFWRDPEPPHAALFQTGFSAVKPHWRIKGQGTASLLVPITDANAANVANLLARCVPMVTIERSDGLLPFVGFPLPASFQGKDTHGMIQLADHTMRLAAANTRIAAENKQASGYFLVDELTAMDQRAKPPIYIDLRYVVPGPAASFALSGQNGDALVREMEKQTDYEGFFTYFISPARVQTFLNWQQRQGVDRRNEDRWQEGDQLADVKYNIDNTKGVKNVTTVGGTGAIPSRPSSTANVGTDTTAAIGASSATVAPTSRRGIGGSIVQFAQGVTDPGVLAARSAQAIVSPQNAAISLEFDIVESAVDMTRVGVGDIRVIGSATAFLGQPLEAVARIIGLELNPDTGVHHAVAVEVN